MVRIDVFMIVSGSGEFVGQGAPAEVPEWLQGSGGAATRHDTLRERPATSGGAGNLCREERDEQVVRSVANLTRRDAEEFLRLAPRVPVRTEVQLYPLEEANRALDDLRNGSTRGAAVLVP
jgi:hypothetical protein